ncbi:response regulator transcription factor [Paenibacillus dakarensis]|uniref:response regulator transcription factor n=1 Tax=Paenibacillus dakarensis TaxID=1527293 RepID=UPI0006D57FFA|nr:response regulator transcription factor [Paenibacillus dakarensis]
MKIQILVIDDEWNMRNLLRIYLMKEGFDVKEAGTGHEALHLMKQHRFDIILLDVMMPDMDGWQICKKAREESQVPILMLTARSETKDKVHGLGIGADDYMTKPFEPEELIARIYSLIRRYTLANSSLPKEKRLHYPELSIHPDGRAVFIHDQAVEFTQKEFDLLHMLAEHSERAFSREELVERLWGHDFQGESRVIDTHVKNIREKVNKAGLSYNPIHTVWGIGYKFHAAGEDL